MELQVLREIARNLKEMQGKNIDNCHKELYFQMSMRINSLIDSAEEERRMARLISGLAYDANNKKLAENFQEISSKSNKQLEELEEVKNYMSQLIMN